MTTEHHNSTIYIKDIDCPACALKIEKSVSNLKGVHSAQMYFGSGKMQVEHADVLQEIVKALKKTGHEFRITQPDVQFLQSSFGEKIYLTLISGCCLISALFFLYLVPVPLLSTISFAASILTGGFFIAKGAFSAIARFSFDMNVLMTIAVTGAMIIGEWFEAAAVVLLFSIGNYLQNRTLQKTRASLSSLMALAPDQALLKTGNTSRQVPIDQLAVGDTVIIKPGEKIPVDGDIVKGATSINQAAITGESVPVPKQTGESVLAGTLNYDGLIEVKMTRAAGESTLSKIIHLIEAAQAQKAPTQRLIDRFARYYTPVILITAALIGVLPTLLFAAPFEEWLIKALILLVISCPCALVISTPVCIVSAVSAASKQGVLVKGGSVLEAAARLKAVAFDKTGTLTPGKPVVVQTDCFTDQPEHALTLAASLEQHSNHPLSGAIVSFAQTRGIHPDFEPQDFRMVPGKGIQGWVEGSPYWIGNVSFLEENGVQVEKTVLDQAEEYESDGFTVVLLSNSQRPLLLFALRDILRPTSRQAVEELKQAGIESIVMLTGDNPKAARAIGNEAGVTDVYAGLLPGQKLDIISLLLHRHAHAAMVGDGVNDGPALAKATVGIAMGPTATDTAIETSDITLVNDDLGKIPYIIALGKKTKQIMLQNIVFSISLKAIFIVLTLLGMANLWMAVFADTGTTLIVIANAMRLLGKRSCQMPGIRYHQRQKNC